MNFFILFSLTEIVFGTEENFRDLKEYAIGFSVKRKEKFCKIYTCKYKLYYILYSLLNFNYYYD